MIAVRPPPSPLPPSHRCSQCTPSYSPLRSRTSTTVAVAPLATVVPGAFIIVAFLSISKRSPSPMFPSAAPASPASASAKQRRPHNAPAIFRSVIVERRGCHVQLRASLCTPV
ncbi:hypothetical protein BOTBODRAFT_398523 [Botryobasidium botryosum FD-172 SS1]|uniref:Uncharacterized protein n=1 Tax=Botryobasidium botryosum (strain FD-172 SS1) TaxID=930990 RepID=A0A067MBU5_BOTB1|nr:hypothetical protein BOTBODRAFT_398523 [Botryobasidium botryosum FD-172 SS1]